MERVVVRRRRRRGPKLGRYIVGFSVLLLAALALYYVAFFPRQIEQAVYPLKYEEEIRRYATEYELDPARVAAVIYCESSFRPDAVSSANALGLMQIVPATGEWIASKLDFQGFDEADLFDPATNIEFGCWYLRYLDGRFDGDLTKATAAYHAGEGTVGQWLDDKEISSDGRTLENIPSKVTGSYVTKVRDVYEKYKEIMQA